MTDANDIPSVSGGTQCSHCGETFERGYVTASADGSTFAVDTDRAVCDVCGWRDVGATGCAPTLDDFETGGLLVRVERDGDTLEPVDVTDSE